VFPSDDVPSSAHSRIPPCGGHLRPDAAKRQVTFRPRGFAPPRRIPSELARGPVASRCRPWGSLRFQPPATRSSLQRVGPGPRGTFPATRFTPLEGFPSSTAVPRHRGRCLPGVRARKTRDRSPPGVRVRGRTIGPLVTGEPVRGPPPDAEASEGGNPPRASPKTDPRPPAPRAVPASLPREAGTLPPASWLRCGKTLRRGRAPGGAPRAGPKTARDLLARRQAARSDASADPCTSRECAASCSLPSSVSDGPRPSLESWWLDSPKSAVTTSLTRPAPASPGDALAGRNRPPRHRSPLAEASAECVGTVLPVPPKRPRAPGVAAPKRAPDAPRCARNPSSAIEQRAAEAVAAGVAPAEADAGSSCLPPQTAHVAVRRHQQVTSQSIHLQGVAPSTSPYRDPTVASGAATYPSMGFVPLRDPLTSGVARVSPVTRFDGPRLDA